jgi:hypothetical protein
MGFSMTKCTGKAPLKNTFMQFPIAFVSHKTLTNPSADLLANCLLWIVPMQSRGLIDTSMINAARVLVPVVLMKVSLYEPSGQRLPVNV